MKEYPQGTNFGLFATMIYIIEATPLGRWQTNQIPLDSIIENQRDVPYQSLMKIFLAERVETELRKTQT